MTGAWETGNVRNAATDVHRTPRVPEDAAARGDGHVPVAWDAERGRARRRRPPPRRPVIRL